MKNHLSGQSSPYLLQHKDNPVWWHPWGEEAFSQAKSQNRPIFLSIGYSSCYWCHVMEHESFEDDEVAALLNAEFISIKVDREERPDVDAIYMDAVVGLTGRGGWPMSVFLTSDLKPFWGGTYFPKPQFIYILGQLSEAWRTRQSEVLGTADELTKVLREAEPSSADCKLSSRELLKRAQDRFSELFDPEFGGFGPAPKFPQSQQLRVLLRAYRAFDSKPALQMVELTLSQMAKGGIYDQIGGGFSRYSTDEQWLVPHFEKMLYDNALLAKTYLEAFQATKKEDFAAIARETLEYIERELTSPSGAFLSSQDAGEVGREGEFYIWEEPELREKLSPLEFNLALDLFGISAEGNFESKNILTRNNLVRTPESIQLARKLLEIRAKRTAPELDTKILTDWNGLTISAFAAAASVLGFPAYLECAKRAMNHILSSVSDGILFHTLEGGAGRIQGMLDDYVFTIQALLDLYVATKDQQYLDYASRLQTTLDRNFWREGRGYAASIAPFLIQEKFEYIDGATPAGNGVAALNLARLLKYFTEARFKERACELIGLISLQVNEKPWGFPSLLLAIDILEGAAHNVCDHFGCAISQDYFGD